MPVHKARITQFINRDVEDWPTAVHDAALSADSNWHEPPGLDELSSAVVPNWAKVGAYIDGGDIHKNPVAPHEKGRRAVERAHRDADYAQLPCFAWATQRGCRFERKGDPSSAATMRKINPE